LPQNQYGARISEAIRMGNSAGSHTKLVQFCGPIRPINGQRKTQRAAAETEIFHVTRSENDYNTRR